MLVKFVPLFLCFAICLGISARVGHGQETVTVALTSKAFQYTILPIAQDRGYLKEEGIDLKIVYMQNAPDLQALSAGSVQFLVQAAARWWQFPKAARLSRLSSPLMIRFCNGW